MEAEVGFSIEKQIMSVIDASGKATTIIGILSVLCLLLGVLIIRKFILIWQVETRKRRFYKDLIEKYDSGDDAVSDDDSDQSDG